MKVLLNGKIKDTKKLDLDTGYYYGYGVFETIYIREGTAVLLKEHLERLNNSLHSIGIDKRVTEEEIEYAIAVLRAYNTALKVNVSEKNILYSTRPINYAGEHYEQGAKLKISSVLRNPTSPSVSIKSMNYMDNIIEIQRAKKEGYNDVLFLNYRDEVCETAVANIFCIKNGQILTPPVDSGLLEGILRRWLMERYEVVEKVLTLEDLKQSEGVFITNSLMGIMKVAQIGEVALSQSDLVTELTRDYVEFLKSISG